MNDILPCCDRCHETMTTDVALFIPWGYITMLWQLLLSWDVDNWRSMFQNLGMNNHALNVVMDDDNWRSLIHTLRIYYPALTVAIRRWQLTEHVSYLRGMIILWPLSWDDDNWRCMLHTLGMFYHVLSVVMRRWQLMKHVSYMNDISPCSPPHV